MDEQNIIVQVPTEVVIQGDRCSFACPYLNLYGDLGSGDVNCGLVGEVLERSIGAMGNALGNPKRSIRCKLLESMIRPKKDKIEDVFKRIDEPLSLSARIMLQALTESFDNKTVEIARRIVAKEISAEFAYTNLNAFFQAVIEGDLLLAFKLARNPDKHCLRGLLTKFEALL